MPLHSQFSYSLLRQPVSRQDPEQTTTSGDHKHPMSFWSRLFSLVSVPVLAGCCSDLPRGSHPGRIWPTGGKLLPSLSLSSWLSFAGCRTASPPRGGVWPERAISPFGWLLLLFLRQDQSTRDAQGVLRAGTASCPIPCPRELSEPPCLVLCFLGTGYASGFGSKTKL